MEEINNFLPSSMTPKRRKYPQGSTVKHSLGGRDLKGMDQYRKVKTIVVNLTPTSYELYELPHKVLRR